MPLCKKQTNNSSTCAHLPFCLPCWPKSSRSDDATHSSSPPLCPNRCLAGRVRPKGLGGFKDVARWDCWGNRRSALLCPLVLLGKIREVSEKLFQRNWDCPWIYECMPAPSSQISDCYGDNYIPPFSLEIPQNRPGITEGSGGKKTSWKPTV